MLEFNAEYLSIVSSEQLTIIDATNGESPKLRDMKKAFNEEVPCIIIRTWIDSLDDFYGKGQLTKSQQKELAALIFSEYPYLRLSEIVVSLREFNRLRNEAIAKYEREKAAAQREAEEADRQNRMSLSQFLSIHGVKSMDEYRSKFPNPNYINNER